MLALANCPVSGPTLWVAGTRLAGLGGVDRTLPRIYRRFPRLWYQLEPDLAARLSARAGVRRTAQPVPEAVAIWPKRARIDLRPR